MLYVYAVAHALLSSTGMTSTASSALLFIWVLCCRQRLGNGRQIKWNPKAAMIPKAKVGMAGNANLAALTTMGDGKADHICRITFFNQYIQCRKATRSTNKHDAVLVLAHKPEQSVHPAVWVLISGFNCHIQCSGSKRMLVVMALNLLAACCRKEEAAFQEGTNTVTPTHQVSIMPQRQADEDLPARSLH